MDWFEIISRFHPKYWTKKMVSDAVVAGKISEEDYRLITGEEYVPVS